MAKKKIFATSEQAAEAAVLQAALTEAVAVLLDMPRFPMTMDTVEIAEAIFMRATVIRQERGEEV